MKKLVFAAVAAMAIISVSNAFAFNNVSSSAAVADTTDSTISLATDTTDSTINLAVADTTDTTKASANFESLANDTAVTPAKPDSTVQE